MKRALAWSVVLLAVIAARVPGFDDAPKTSVDILFSPHGGCTDRIVAELGSARSKIRVQAYSFTSAPIAKAILDAKKRGVDCEVILDRSQATQTYSEADFFFNQGVPSFIDDKHAIAHNKIILIDSGATVITGSFNFTKAAEETNAENLVIFKGYSDVAARYGANYAEHLSHARKYEGRAASTQNALPPTTVEGPQRAAGAATQQAKDITVYVTKSGTKYHRDGCSYLRKSATPMPLSEAARRYGPCSRCRPATP